jgi:hypothetical protein
MYQLACISCLHISAAAEHQTAQPEQQQQQQLHNLCMHYRAA